jgi:hypothetical protein
VLKGRAQSRKEQPWRQSRAQCPSCCRQCDGRAMLSSSRKCPGVSLEQVQPTVTSWHMAWCLQDTIIIEQPGLTGRSPAF